MTERLFDTDSYLTKFSATVISCRQAEDGFAVTLDRTAFFPEGGGQKGDRGVLGDLPVRDTQEGKDGTIEHFVPAPLAVGTVVEGEADFETRFARMQNHTAEHIFSGLVFRTFGLKNVGFHLGDGYMTMDYDGALTKADTAKLEQMTMREIFASKPVRAWFPERPEDYDYRSKKELTGRIRLVEIPGVDLCACCAPHLRSTAEAGCFKVLSCERYKGGVRLTCVAGAWAMRTFSMAWEQLERLSALLSLPPEEAAQGAEKLAEKLKAADETVRRMRREDTLRRAEMSETPYLFVDDALLLPAAADALRTRFDGPVAAFAGSDADGYRFLLLFDDPADRERALTLWNASGGGKPGMLQGLAHAGREKLTSLWRS